MNSANTATPDPWYRQRWPWFLMAGPAIVVVAGFITLGLAIQSFDGLVADDYYKQGKAINMTLTRDAKAHELGYRAGLSLTTTGGVSLKFDGAAPGDSTLRLTLHHPTRAGFDRDILLARTPDGGYSAAMPPIDSMRWGMTLEDAKRTWRLTGDWNTGDELVRLGDKR